MRFELFNPWSLLGFAAAAVCIVAALRSFAGLGRVQRTLHLTLRLLTVLALAAALSGITFDRTRTHRGTHVLILAPHRPQSTSQDPFQDVIAAAADDDRVETVTATDRSAAGLLSCTPARFAANVTPRVLFANPVETIDDATLAAARDLRTAGIRVDVDTRVLKGGPRIVSASVLGECRVGVPFDVQLVADGADAAQPTTCVFDAPGPQVISLTGDSLLPVWVCPPVRALIVKDADAPVEHLHRALNARGIQTEVLDTSALTTTTPSWDAFDAVILANVAAAELGDPRAKQLARYVFEGGGLVMLGGSKSFGCGGYYKTPLERALPVHMDPLRDPPSYAVVIVMDKSWSMGDAVGRTVHKVDLVREVSIAATTPLTENDFFGLISFDAQPHVIVELRKLTDRALITKTISTLGAFGTTNFYRAMSKAFELLKDTKATYKHIVLLSDGRSSVPRLNYETLVGDMRKKRVTVSTIGVGDDCHRQLLADIAAWGKGKGYHIATADRIPQVILEESNRLKEILTVEVPSAVKVKTDDAVLAGIDVSKSPKLLGFNRVRAKDSSEVILTVSTKDEPLLCLWHHGVGRAAAFASDAGPRWCADWIADWSDDTSRLWQEIVLAVARPVPATGSALRIEHAPRPAVVFDTANAWGLPRTGLTLTAEITRWLNTRPVKTVLPLSECGVGVYRASLPQPVSPPWLIHITDPGGRTQALAGTARIDGPALTNAERARRAQMLADAGGGQVNPTPHDLFAADAVTTARRVNVRDPMLLLALVCSLLDVVVRRAGAIGRLFRKTQGETS